MKQLDPKAVWLFFFSSISGFFVIALILSFGVGAFIQSLIEEEVIEVGPVFGFGKIIIPVLFMLIVSYVWAKLSYRFYKYELTDAGFRKEYGVIWKKYVTIPYDRIQNVDIYRGIIARILGLSDLNIQTAGGTANAMMEGRLPGVSKEVAEQLRDELINRIRRPNGQGL